MEEKQTIREAIDDDSVGCYKFNKSSTYSMEEAFGGILSRSVEDFLAEKFSDRFGFGSDHMRQDGRYLQGGWALDFTPWLEEYLVESCWGNWQHCWADTPEHAAGDGGVRVVAIEEGTVFYRNREDCPDYVSEDD
jgi:hypothetical protein